MEKKRILVTGSGGFIGWHLVRYLKEEGHWVRGVDIKNAEFGPSYANEFLLRDLRYRENCREVLKDIDWVFHLAANMGGIGYITKVFAEIIYDNAMINLNMIDEARKAKVEKFFFSSSACVYPLYRQNQPDISGLKEHEAWPSDPDSFYGNEKLFTEKVLEAYHLDYGMEVRIARFHNIYGPYGTWKGGKEKAPAAISRKIVRLKDGDILPIWGDGLQTRSFCYIDDCVIGFYKLMLSGHNDPINIGSDRIVTIDELAEMIMKIAGKKLKIKHDLTKPQGVRGRNSDNQMMREVLKWEPKITLEEGLKITYKWIKKQVEKEN